MSLTRVIFLSAVTREFHLAPPEQRHQFQSYRDVLDRAFRALAPHYEVVLQENLALGFGDLLETLDHEIARSLIVIHLIGDMAGFPPEPLPVHNLFDRHPNFLPLLPELKAGAAAGITYTQWELYLGFYHRKRTLIFEAETGAPRSPLCATSEDDRLSQRKHRQRIEATGHHRRPFHDQGDLARKSLRAFLHFRVDPMLDSEASSESAVAEAWSKRDTIVNQLVAAIKKPDPRVVPVVDPANVAAFVGAVRAAATRWHVNLATIVDIAARYEEDVRAAATNRPTPEALYNQGFAELALGDFRAAAFSGRRAAELAHQLSMQQPEDAGRHRDAAINAFFLTHEADKAAHDIPNAIGALEQASGLIDKQHDPVRWADINQPLAEFLLEQAQLDRAKELINDLVDIREEHQPASAHLAKTLLLWAKFLYDCANYDGSESVARRAEQILAAQTPPNLPGVAAGLKSRAIALQATNRLAEAEPLFRRALAIDEQSFGLEDPNVARSLNNLAHLLHATNRLAEAESLYRRALAIDEQIFGPQHPNVAVDLNNLAQLLQDTNRLGEAEPLMRRSLAVNEQSFGPQHPDVALGLNNLARLLQDTNRPAEAEPLYRRALAVDEQTLGQEHPKVAMDLNNLARLFQDTNRLAEAEPLLRRALEIFEKRLGADHPNVAMSLNNLAQLLQACNRLTEAEPLLRRAVAIFERGVKADHPHVGLNLGSLAQLLLDTNRLAEAEPLLRRAVAIFEKSLGFDHPNVATSLNGLALLLKATNRLAEAEPLYRRALAIDERSFGSDHPNVARDLNNLAQLLQATNRLTEAEPLLRRGILIEENSHGKDHPLVSLQLNNLALLLQSTNRLEEAETLFRRALAINEQSFGPEHPKVATDLNNLSALLGATNRPVEAEPLLQRAVEIVFKFSRVTGLTHPNLQAFVNNYGRLLGAMGRRPEEVVARINAVAKPFGLQFTGRFD